MEDVKIVVDKKEETKVEDVAIVSPELEKKVEEVKIVATQENTTPVIEKKVKVKMREDHKCYIGGEWYYLLKDKTYNVPENVKGILASSDLLLPL